MRACKLVKNVFKKKSCVVFLFVKLFPQKPFWPFVHTYFFFAKLRFKDTFQAVMDYFICHEVMPTTSHQKE
jgi:hypothetical protein